MVTKKQTICFVYLSYEFVYESFGHNINRSSATLKVKKIKSRLD